MVLIPDAVTMEILAGPQSNGAHRVLEGGRAAMLAGLLAKAAKCYHSSLSDSYRSITNRAKVLQDMCCTLPAKGLQSIAIRRTTNPEI